MGSLDEKQLQSRSAIRSETDILKLGSTCSAGVFIELGQEGMVEGKIPGRRGIPERCGRTMREAGYIRCKQLIAKATGAGDTLRSATNTAIP